MNLVKLFSLTLIISMLFVGCATNLPMTSTLNDFVMMGTKTNSTDKVSFTYNTNITDGLIKPYERDKTKELSGHPGFNHTQSSTLNRMLNEYMGNKFSKLSDINPPPSSLSQSVHNNPNELRVQALEMGTNIIIYNLMNYE